MTKFLKYALLSGVVLLALQGCARMEKLVDIIWGEDQREPVDPTGYKQKRGLPENRIIPETEEQGLEGQSTNRTWQSGVGAQGTASQLLGGTHSTNPVVQGYKKDLDAIEAGRYNPLVGK